METPALNNTLDYMDLLDVYRTFCLKAAEYTFFSSVHGTFSRIDHMLGHKTSLNKFKEIEIKSITGRKKKNHKYIEIKQPVTEQLLGHKRNERRNKHIPKGK